MKIQPAIAILLVFMGWHAGPVSAQIPAKFTNLKVLPQDIAAGRLVAEMRDFSIALGVRCNHCHVGENSATLEGFDFAADSKTTKLMARDMMRMTRDLNEQALSHMARPTTVTIRCATCHRGLAIPTTLTEVLTATADRDGVDAALKQYRLLRDQSYGKGTYDFSSATLNAVAEHLSGDKHDTDGAIVVVRFNLEANPGLWTTYQFLGQLYEQKGDKASARRAIEQALQLDPTNEFLKQRLVALSKS